MRIVSGQYGGRRLSVPKGRDIRPTSDKVRGAIFNALESLDVVKGAYVLDGFCGTGALGLEALSRGAIGCTFIDKSRTSLDLARANADMLGAKNCEFVKADLLRPLNMMPNKSGVSTLIFLDPPYHKSYAVEALNNFHKAEFLVGDIFVVLEVEKNFENPLPDFLDVQNEKIYGDTKILFLRSE